MAVGESGLLLACGVPLDALVDQIAEHRSPADASHQAGCPHCQAAVAALEETWKELRGFGAQPVAAPAGLGDQIMVRLRALAARRGEAAVLTGPAGETRIEKWVLGQIAGRAALTVPGVLLASALSVAVDPVDRSQVRLSLRLAIMFGPAIDPLSEAVRDRIRGHLSAQTGVRVAGVDIAVEDVVADA